MIQSTFPNEIFDTYLWQKDKQVITRNEHKLPGLGNFTHWSLNKSYPPTPSHFHSGIIEIHCMVKGQRVSILENTHHQNTYTVLGNELFLTFPYELHSTGDQSPCEFYALQINTEERNQLLGLNEEYSNALCDALLTLDHRHYALSNTALAQIRTAFNLFISPNKHDFHTAVQYISCFLHNLLYLKPIGNGAPRHIELPIKKAIDYINLNSHRPLSLTELASVSGYSLSHFKAKFKEEMGITPAEFVSLQKISKAKMLLETSNIPITDVALDLGFSSSNYFCSVFKKQTGISPLQYRKNILSHNSDMWDLS